MKTKEAVIIIIIIWHYIIYIDVISFTSILM